MDDLRASPPGHHFTHPQLLSIEGLSAEDILFLLERSDEAIQISRAKKKQKSALNGRTQINLFFEESTRTQASFELAGKRLGADGILPTLAMHDVFEF